MQTLNAEPLSLADLWNVIIRYKQMLILLTLAFFIVGLLYCFIAPKMYKAESVVLMENQAKNVEIKSVLSEMPNDQSLVPSEIQVLISRNLMGKVLDDLKLTQPLTDGIDQNARIEREDRIDSALRSLEVKQIEKSRAISVAFYSKDATMAANMVNTLTKLYIEQQISNNFEAVRLTNSWLSDRVEELQRKVKESEQKVADYRARTGLVESQDGDMAEQDISGLSKKLNDAKAKLAETESKLSEIDNIKTLDSAPSVLSSILIQKLRESEAETRSELASLSNTLGKNHPQIKEARAKLGSIQSKIRSETLKIAEGVRREYQSSFSNVQLIESQIVTLKETYNIDKSENVDLAALEREAETNRKFLETINLRWKETQSQEDARLQAPYARVISTATIPSYPESPKKKLIILASLLAGLGLGCGIALVRDQLQNTIYNGRQIQDMTGITNISMIADVRTPQNMSIPNFADIPLTRQDSGYMDGIRELSAFLKMRQSKSPADKVYCFSSSTKNEGKSSLVGSLARQLAIEGYKVLAIDCDIRGQSLTKMFGVSDRVGLTELLSGKLHLQDVIVTDAKSPLSLIAIGEGKGNINLFMRSPEAWQKMVTDAAKSFDIVLLDNSPSLASPEARIISSIGQNIFCIRWKKTPIKVIGYALDSLKRSDAKIIGTVLTMAANKDNPEPSLPHKKVA